MSLSRLADALNMSPALRRYYRDSVVPCLAALVLTVLQPWLQMLAETGTPLRAVFALLPMPGLLWMFAVYLRFLRECDELERRIELQALVWSAAAVLHAGMALVFLLSADTFVWSGENVASAMSLILLLTYVLVRAGLHRKYR